MYGARWVHELFVGVVGKKEGRYVQMVGRASPGAGKKDRVVG